MSTKPQVGDIVDVVVKGVRVTHVEPAMPGFGAVVYAAIPKANGNGNDNSMLISADSPAITLTVTTPATSTEWPPQAGDLWRDKEGDVWFGVDVRFDDTHPKTPIIELASARGRGHEDPADAHRQWGPLTLVHREQAADVWPPQAGDLWKDDDGDEWTAEVDGFGDVLMRLNVDGRVRGIQDVVDNYGPLTFVRREQP